MICILQQFYHLKMTRPGCVYNNNNNNNNNNNTVTFVQTCDVEAELTINVGYYLCVPEVNIFK